MYQSRASIYNDLKKLAGTDRLVLDSFFEVDDLESVIEALGAFEVVEPKRKTLWCYRDIVRERGQHRVFPARIEGAPRSALRRYS